MDIDVKVRAAGVAVLRAYNAIQSLADAGIIEYQSECEVTEKGQQQESQLAAGVNESEIHIPSAIGHLIEGCGLEWKLTPNGTALVDTLVMLATHGQLAIVSHGSEDPLERIEWMKRKTANLMGEIGSDKLGALLGYLAKETGSDDAGMRTMSVAALVGMSEATLMDYQDEREGV